MYVRVKVEPFRFSLSFSTIRRLISFQRKVLGIMWYIPDGEKWKKSNKSC